MLETSSHISWAEMQNLFTRL